MSEGAARRNLILNWKRLQDPEATSFGDGFHARRVWDSLWFVPAVYVLVVLGLSVGLVRWDEADPIVLARSVNASSATSALSALGSGMIDPAFAIRMLVDVAIKALSPAVNDPTTAVQSLDGN